MPSNLRRHPRTLLTEPIQLNWTDSQGRDCAVYGKCAEISESGLGAEVQDPIQRGTYVNFRIERVGFAGSGSVRYCNRVKMKYRIGIEFSGGLRWKGPKTNVKMYS